LSADPRLSVDKRHSGGGYTGFSLPPTLDRNLLNLDGDEHGRIRRVAASAFSARSVAGLRDRIEGIAATIVAGLPAGGPVDLIAELCVPLPALVIGDLLGVPAELCGPLREAAAAMVAFDASAATPRSGCCGRSSS
jgi:cytochrome P450